MLHTGAPRCSQMGTLVLLSCVLILLGLSSACAAGPPVTGASLLTGTPCAPPCWEGITPGKSDEEQVLHVLSNSPFVRAGSIDSREVLERGGALTEIEWYGRGKAPSWVYLRDNLVLRNEVRLDQGPTLEQIVEKYGPPEAVQAYLRFPPVYVVILDYPARGFTLWSLNYPAPFVDLYKRFLVDNHTGRIEKGLRVRYVIYYAPTSLPAALRDVFLYNPGYAEKIASEVHPWRGFGPIPLSKAVR